MMGRRMGRPGLIGLAARTAVVAGTATAVSGSMQKNSAAKQQTQADADAYNQQQQDLAMQQAAQQAVAAAQPQYAPAPPAAAPVSAGDDLMSQLSKLADLKAAGVLSDEEFTAAKAKLLN